jgi:hypothetical protein
MDGILCSETPILKKAARRNIPEDGILEVLHSLPNIMVQIANKIVLKIFFE